MTLQKNPKQNKKTQPKTKPQKTRTGPEGEQFYYLSLPPGTYDQERVLKGVLKIYAFAGILLFQEFVQEFLQDKAQVHMPNKGCDLLISRKQTWKM